EGRTHPRRGPPPRSRAPPLASSRTIPTQAPVARNLFHPLTATMTPAPRNAVALLVGIGYPDSPGIAPLRFAARDAPALGRLVADPLVWAFPPDKVALLTDTQATRAGVVRHLSRWLPEAAKGAELVFFYFAGHGVVERIGGREEGYLLPSDAG